MNWMCPQCGFNINIEDSQVPPYAFAYDCPRCRKNITITPPAKPDAVLKGDGGQQRGGTVPRQPAAAAGAAATPSNSGDMMQGFMQMMATMMAGSPQKATEVLQKGFAWQRKHVLVCCADPTQRQTVDNTLDKARHDITTPQSSAQAIEV